MRERIFKNLKLMAVVPVLGAGTACYMYQPAPLTAVEPGRSVRVTLTPEGAAGLASTIGPGATTLDGRVLARTPADVTLALTQIQRGEGPEEFLQNDRLTLPWNGTSSVAVRSLDKPRTVLAAGGIAAVVIVGKIFGDQAGIFSTKSTVSSSTK
jgi:hypothetical protein